MGKGAAVRRLVGTTFSEFVMGERLDSAGEREVNHVLVMLYHSPPQVAKKRFCAKEGGACVAHPYVLKSSGTCDAFIDTLAECEAASTTAPSASATG